MDERDFLLMDFDTYHQIFGGDFLEYFAFMEELKKPQLEDKSLRNQGCLSSESEESLEVISDLEKLENNNSENVMSTILLIILELIAGRYGDFRSLETYQNLSDKEKVIYLFSYLEKQGLSKEQILEKITNFYGKRNKKR